MNAHADEQSVKTVFSSILLADLENLVARTRFDGNLKAARSRFALNTSKVAFDNGLSKPVWENLLTEPSLDSVVPKASNSTPA